MFFFQEIFRKFQDRGEHLWFPTNIDCKNHGLTDFTEIPLLTSMKDGKTIGLSNVSLVE